MSKFKHIMAVLALATIAAGIAGCKKEDDQVSTSGNNNGTNNTPKDVVASVMLSLLDDQDSVITYVGWSDLDGPGGELPLVDAVSLKPNVKYHATLRFEDANGKNISDQVIKPNGTDYKVCLTGGLGLSATTLDKDAKSLGLGLIQDIMITQSGNGSLQLTIKDQKGVKNGDCSPGSVYFNCSFPLSAQ